MRVRKTNSITPEGKSAQELSSVAFLSNPLWNFSGTLSSGVSLQADIGFNFSLAAPAQLDYGSAPAVSPSFASVVSSDRPILEGAIVANSSYGASSTALNVAAAVTEYASATGGVLNGAGLKIGILSDSFNVNGGEAAAIAGGYLPAANMIDIVKEGPAGSTDEGMAMAELIHAVAPGAQIYFYTAFDSEADFANGITTLASLGCSVIVDDVAYGDEPFYQNSGTITQAIENAVASGVNYFTAAGNGSNNFYEQAFTPIAGGFNLPGIGTEVTDNVSGGSPYEAVSLGTGAYLDFTLQWTQPFGANAYDLGVGLYRYNSFTHSYTLVDNFTTGGPTTDPILSVQTTEFVSAGTYYLAFYETNGAPITPGEFKLIFFQDSNATITGIGAGVGSGAVFGHELAVGANAVAAVGVTNTPSQGVSPPVVESFSDYGPGKTYINAGGTILTTPVVDNSPAFAAPDGSATTIFDPFDGTSAAAPNAAAVSLLMLQADGRLQTKQVTYLLERSAIPTASTLNGGAGLIQANVAVAGAITASNTPIWTAQGGSDLWSLAANWSDNLVPGATSAVQITDGLGLFTSTYAVIDNIGLDSITSLLVDGSSFTGAIPDLTIQAADTLSTGNLTLGNGTIDVLGALLDTGALVAGSAAGTIILGAQSELLVGSSLAAETIDFSGTSSELVLSTASSGTLQSGLAATINNFIAGDSIDLSGLAESLVSSIHTSGSEILLENATGTILAQLDITGQTLSVISFSRDSSGGTVLADNACFCAGTRILTTRGDIAVETLKIGDEVITCNGDTAPVRWIGYRHLDISRHICPAKVQPICINADALAEGVPSRDLYLSPDHAIYHDGFLVPAKALVNGANITQVIRRHVTYYHVELEEHAVLFAEHLPAESYLDTGNRDCFENSCGALQLHPDFAQDYRERNSCGIFIETGPVVASLRDRAKARHRLTTAARLSRFV
ncbi:MAG: Hint domain-containing protein [Acidocella sp.]|nr:Hint domain-containing protein [Acidocella sp.]